VATSWERLPRPLIRSWGPLQDNGGPTFTHALLPGSPAINAGNNSRAIDEADNPLLTDQRGEGFPRIVTGIVDIGSYELPNLAPDAVDDSCNDEILALNEALANLSEADETAANVVKLKYFAGLAIPQIAELLDISSRTADRRWAYARARLYQELCGE
jgi:DNA-directed RNA polymerase specialized sigma24 family protein